ncbi:MAG: N-acetylglucosamine-6-phosphate deacetylase [Propionicimonas sp.]
MLISANRVLLADVDDFAPGWVQVTGGRIVAAGSGEPPSPPDEVIDGWLIPGYVDPHSHGGGGASFVTDDPADVDTVLSAHRAVGTTTMVASLVTGSIPDLKRQVRLLAQKVSHGDLAGIHLEGPWLAEKFKGAHPVSLLADPDPAVVEELLEAGGGAVKMVTIAPERPGALEAIKVMVAHGCVPAIGHTNADYETTRAAVAAGARGATHLFNAMPTLKHREPGPVLALWEDPRVVLELVFDGIHVRPELAAFVMRTVPDRVSLITDAMAAAGAPDGDYVLGELAVEVRDRVARLAGSDTIAGSTLTLDRAVHNAVAAGVPLAQAVRSATCINADYLGLTDVGRIATGLRADLVVLDDRQQVTRVMFRGVWQ